MTRKTYHVFLSYDERHRPAVEELARWLVREGLTPFFDWWDLVPGEPELEARERALADSACCAVILGTGEPGTGTWSDIQIRAAIERQASARGGEFRVIPVLLPGAEWPAADRPVFLRQNQPAVFSQTLDDDEALYRLACGIRNVPPGPRHGAAVVPGVEPYRGLKLFEEAHAPLFFGRERLTRELVGMLEAPAVRGRGGRLLAVLGPSGSGKSSVVRAGLIPALRSGALEGSDGWPVAIIKPGSQPMESLAVAVDTLGRGAAPPVSVYDRVARGSDGARSLHVAARLVLGEPPSAPRMILVIDQFEELFTLCAETGLRGAFIDNLVTAASVPLGPVVVVLAMRADFYNHCASYPALADLLVRRQALVSPMTVEELRWAIEKPAHRCGVSLDAGLVDLLLKDALGPTVEPQSSGPEHPGHLPLLEFALEALWKRRVGARMAIGAYREIGGLVGALERHADAVLAQIVADDPAGEATCRRALLALVHPGQGTEDTRKTVPFHALATDPGAVAVVQRLVEGRLLTTDDPERVQSSVELAHEALIRNWPLLRKWIAEEREDLLTRERLADDAREWADERGRHPDFLYDGARLELAREWSDRHSEEARHLGPVDEFLAASRERRRRREDAELEAAQRVAALAEDRRRAEEARALEAERRERVAQDMAGQERKARRLTAALAVAAILTVLVGSGSWLYVKSRNDAFIRNTELAVTDAMVKTQQDQAKAHASSAESHDLWNAAMAAAKRAEDLLDSGEVTPEFRRRTLVSLADFKSDYQAAEAAAAEAKRDTAAVAEIERIRRLGWAGAKKESNGTKQLYADVFKMYGVSLDSLEPPEAAALIAPIKIRVELAAALDHWAMLEEKDKKTRLIETAKIADPDSWRNRVRDALLVRDTEKLSQLAKEADVKTQPTSSVFVLGETLITSKGRGYDGTLLLERAQLEHPNEFLLNLELGSYMGIYEGFFPDAVRFLSSAIALRPEDASACHFLGIVYRRHGDDKQAVTYLQRSIALDFRNLQARILLADSLVKLQNLEDARGALDDAARLKPEDEREREELAEAFKNVGNGYLQKDSLDKAFDCYKQALRVLPGYADAQNNLGVVLTMKGEYDEAITRIREAIRLRKGFVKAQQNLALALFKTGRHDEAIKTYEEVLRDWPTDVPTLYQLAEALATKGEHARAATTACAAGDVLADRGSHEGAAKAYRDAIRYQPEMAVAHLGLGQVLEARGLYSEASVELRRGHELGSKMPGWSYPSAQLVSECERLKVLDRKLPALLCGEFEPTTNEERTSLALICQQKGINARSAQLYFDALKADPGLAKKANSVVRYNAACVAALAGTGNAKDIALLDARDEARWRDQSRAWLRSELTDLARKMNSLLPWVRSQTYRILDRWTQDPDLAAVRDFDLDARRKLGAKELEEWGTLWREVNKLLGRER